MSVIIRKVILNEREDCDDHDYIRRAMMIKMIFGKQG